jgi:hypothetical protein
MQQSNDYDLKYPNTCELCRGMFVDTKLWPQILRYTGAEQRLSLRNLPQAEMLDCNTSPRSSLHPMGRVV